MTGRSQRFSCPCCGNRTLSESPPGTFEVCPVCFWEDDDVQFKNPSFAGGANRVSLEEARMNYRAFGASMPEHRQHVRTPRLSEIPQ
jgi:hypothetical protein